MALARTERNERKIFSMKGGGNSCEEGSLEEGLFLELVLVAVVGLDEERVSVVRSVFECKKSNRRALLKLAWRAWTAHV